MKILIALCVFLSACSSQQTPLLNQDALSQWRDAQPTEQVSEAFAVWKQVATACLPKIEAGQVCYIPPSPISMTYNANLESRQESARGGLETAAAIAAQLAPVAATLGLVGLGAAQ